MARKKQTKKAKKPILPLSALQDVAKRKAEGKPIRSLGGKKLSVGIDREPVAALLDGVGVRPLPPKPSIAILDTRTPEQRALHENGAWAERLYKEHPLIMRGRIALTNLRQMYASVNRELNQLIADVREDFAKNNETLPAELEDFISMHAAYDATRAFTEHKMMQWLREVTLPFMADYIDRNSEQDEIDARDDQRRAIEERKAKPIEIGMFHTPAAVEDSTTLQRNQSLVLIGWRNAVLMVLDHITKSAVAANSNVTRLTVDVPKKGEQSNKLLKIGGTLWHGCANSDRTMAIFAGQYIVERFSDMNDLLICDQMSEANTTGFIGRSSVARAGDAFRRFRRWCDAVGCGFIAGYLLPDKNWGPGKVPDTNSDEFEAMRTTTLLRTVLTEELDAETYKVTVGHYAHVFEVKKDVLDKYGHANLIVPGEIK